jgi:hypothetical protein
MDCYREISDRIDGDFHRDGKFSLLISENFSTGNHMRALFQESVWFLANSPLF